MKKELFQACIFNSANLEVSGTEMFDFRRKSLERGGSYGSSPFVDVIEHANALMSGVTARNHTCEKIYLFYWDTIAHFWGGLFSKSISTRNTDLVNLIGNTQWGSFRILCHSDFTWNQIWSFWIPQNWHFDQLRSSECSIFGNFWPFQVWIFSKITIHSLQNCLNCSSFRNKPNLISRKIRVAEN